MHETDEEVTALQALLDASHGAGGPHLRSIFSEARRMTAAELCELLTGVQILSLATVTAACEPRVAPVDGLFYRSAFYFGSSPESVRFAHIDQRPQVSAAHVRGEELAVLVHGRADRIDMSAPDTEGFRRYLIEVYGDGWSDWASGSPYARIHADMMFAARFKTTE